MVSFNNLKIYFTNILKMNLNIFFELFFIYFYKINRHFTIVNKYKKAFKFISLLLRNLEKFFQNHFG
jgi:hypothetical protein